MSTPGVPGGALPFSGPLDLAAINSEWGLGTDLAIYHDVRWYYDGNLTTGLFGGNTIKVSDFYGKRATDPAGGGTYFSNTGGSGSYTTTLYRNSITIEIWGAGGGGGGGNGGAGGKGGDSSTLGVTAGGGAGGGAGNIPVPPPPVNVEVSDRGGKELGQYGYRDTLLGVDVTRFTDNNGQVVGTVLSDSNTGAPIGQQGQTGPYGGTSPTF